MLSSALERHHCTLFACALCSPACAQSVSPVHYALLTVLCGAGSNSPAAPEGASAEQFDDEVVLRIDVEQEYWKTFNVHIQLKQFDVLLVNKHVFARTTGGLELKLCNIMQVC